MNWFKKNKEPLNTAVLDEQKIKMLRDAAEAVTKGVGAVLGEMAIAMHKHMDAKFLEVEKLLAKPEKTREVVQGEEATVYGFYCVRRVFTVSSVGSMLIIVIAKDPVEAGVKMNEIMLKSGYVPSEWDVLMRNNIDLIIKGERVKEKEIKPRELKSDEYVSHLLYARDKFTDTPHEKATLTKIINKIKQKYAISNPVK